MWSVQKVSPWPRARNILQVGRARRVKTPISHPPKTPNLPPPRGTLTQRHRQKKCSLLWHYFLLSYYSFTVLTWLFSAVSPPTLSYLCSLYRKSSLPHFVCSLLSFAPSVPCLLVSQAAWCFLSFFFAPSFCHSFVLPLLCFFFFFILAITAFFFPVCSPFPPHWNGVLCNASFLFVTK